MFLKSSVVYWSTIPAEDSINGTNNVCMYINTDPIDISNNNHDAISPLSIQGDMVEQSTQNFVMDV